MIRAKSLEGRAGQWYKVGLVSTPSVKDEVLAARPDQAAEAWCKARLAAEDGPAYVVVIDPYQEAPHNTYVYEVGARIEVEWDARHLG